MSKFRKIFLVNWLDLPYAQIDLDANITIFEGGNGSGKTSIMLAAFATLMPDKKQLRSRKVSIEKHAEEAIFHRLQTDEPIAYAALEIQLPNELVLAGVQITKQKESNSIDLEPFTIRKWRDCENAQDFFRFVEGDKELTCNLSELKQRAGEWGVHLQAHSTLSSYFKELYDIGVLPLAMATDAERSQYAHLLETSMAGGLSATLAVKLKEYLLPESDKLPSTVKLMHDNLRACIETQNELQRSEEHYASISGLFQNLTGYIIALGKRVERETNAANEALKLTEQNLETVKTDLVNLEAEKQKQLTKQAALEKKKQSAISEIKTLVETKTQEEQDLTQEVKEIGDCRSRFLDQIRPINESKVELESAISLLNKLYPDTAVDSDAKSLEIQIKKEGERIDAEIRELDALVKENDAELFELKKRHGVSSEFFVLAEKLGATPVLQRYAEIEDLQKAALIQAKLGPLVNGLIVNDVDGAVKQISKLDPDLAEIWLTAEKDPANALSSTTHGHFQKIDHEPAIRLTRNPSRPILGEAARKKRIEELDRQTKSNTKAVSELRAVKLKLDPIIKHLHRVAEVYQSHSLPLLIKSAKLLQSQIDELQLKLATALNKIEKAKEEAAQANKEIEKVFAKFKKPEDEINSELSRNETSVALKNLLKPKLDIERTNGIAKHIACKKVWNEIREIPELGRKNEIGATDIGAALERLRNVLKQVPNHERTSASVPQAVGEDIFIAALELPKIRREVLALIQAIQPHDLAGSSDPEILIQALTQKVTTLTGRFEEQQKAFRANIDTIANSIRAEIHNRTQRILSWSNDLKEVQFGTVKGIRLRLEKIESQLAILDSLRQQKELFSESKLDPKSALQEFWKERTGQELTAQSALDYRRFVSLSIEVSDGRGKWRAAGGSTGEMVGAALSVLIVLFRAWEEEAAFRTRVDPLRLLFLDEASRLDETSHATLESLSTSFGVQFVVAAPVVAASGKFTHYTLTRKEVGNQRRVFIRGRRRFYEPEQNDSDA